VKQKVMLFVAGLFVGLVAGFIVTNYLNRPEFAVGQQTASANARPAGQPAGQPAAEGAPGSQPGNAPTLTEEDLAHIKQQVDSRPESYEDNLMLAEYLLRVRGVPKDSLTYYERAHKLKPSEVKPLMGLGDGHFDAAASPDEHGHAVYDSAMLAKAAEFYEKALAVDPRNVNARTDLGLTYFFRTPQDVDRAIAEYRKSLAIDPEHDKTLQNLTAALLAKGDVAEAEKTLVALRAVNGSNPALPQLQSNLERVKSGEQIPSH
jgi:tetratricopeptide (TPR) repeat protein